MPWTQLLWRVPLALAALLGVCASLLRFDQQVVQRLGLRGDPRWGPLWPLVVLLRALAKKSAPLPTQRAVLLYAGCGLTLAATLVGLGSIPLAPNQVGAETICCFTLRTHLLALLALNWVGLLGLLLGAWSWGTAPAAEDARHVAVQALHYSLLATLAMAGAALLSDSLVLSDMVAAQERGWPFVLQQPLGALLCALALTLGSRRQLWIWGDERAAALSDYHLLHSGTPWALYQLAEYLNLLLSAAILSTVYLGGGSSPLGSGLHWVLLKTLGVALVLLWLRGRWLAQRQRELGRQGPLLVGALALLNTALTAWIVYGGWGRGGL